MAALTVPTIFTAVDKLSSVIAKMQGNVGKFKSESQKKYAAMSRSAQAWSSNSRQIAMSAGIMGAALIAPLVLATKAAADFEDQMANVGTIVGEKNLPFLSEGTLAVLRKTPVPLHDLTEALYKITSAGVPASKALDVLTKSAQLGVAGRGTAIQGADALTSAMNVFKDEGLTTNKMMTMLFQTVKYGKTTIEGLSESFGATANIIHSGGISMKDFLSATAAMTVMGEPAAQAMNQIRASVFGLEKPTTRMKFIFKELGVKNIHELIGKFGNLGNSMSAIEEKGTKLGVNMGQAWGKVGSYAAVIALTGARGKGAYNTNLAGMGNSEADFAVAYALKLKTMNAQLQLVKNNMLDFSIVLGTQLIPVLTRIMPHISNFINGLADWMKRHKDLTVFILKVVGALGLFLLAVAAIALPVSLVADAVKIYAGIQLFFASSTAAATTAVAAETVAVATAGTQLSLFAEEAVAANVAVGGFFATLSEFVVPAALVALGGLAIWKTFQGWQDDQRMSKATSAPTMKFNTNSAMGKISPFGNPGEESAYQKWWLQQDKLRIPRDSLERTNFNQQHGKEYGSLLKLPSQFVQTDSTNTTNSKLDIHLHDGGNNIKDLKFSGHNIPVKVTSTTGNK